MDKNEAATTLNGPIFPNSRSAKSIHAGFTFVELTIVMAIVAILAAIAIPNFLEARVRSAVSRSRGELALLNMAVDSYRLEEGSFPLNAVPGEAGSWDLRVLTTPVVYLSRLPMDALTTQDARGRNHPTPLNPVPYRFYNALQLGAEEGLKPFDAYSDRMLRGFGAGLLWGLGPHGALRPDGGTVATTIHPGGAVQVLPYNPTNGTTSPGDIYQMVP